MAKPTPGVSFDSKGQYMLVLDRSSMPSVEDLAQPELRIAGLRINPNNFGPSRSAYITNITIKEVSTGKEFSLTGLPANLKAGNLQWSPNDDKAAFTNTTNNAVDIYAETDPVNPYPMGGYKMLVRAEIFRGRFRKSYENPSAFTPSKIEEVKFELPSIAHNFKKGHRIMVQVQSSWFPLVDRNPQQFIDIYHCDAKDFIKSNIKVYHDAKNASKIILPVLK